MDAIAATQPSRSPGLSEREAEILAFEGRQWRFGGAKEDAVRDRFGISITAYYQVLNSLIDRPEALEQDPVLVSRLQRLRASRRRGAARGPGAVSG